MPNLRRRIAFIIVAITSVLTIGTTGFMVIDHYPFFDAFYMAVITVSTVGYQEIHPLSTAGRMFNSVLILVGVISLLLAVGAMTQTIFELELNRFFEKRQMRRMIEKLSGHYIVCGYGKVGRGAAKELKHAGVPFAVIEKDERKVEQAMHDEFIAVVGDATKDDNLRELGVLRAKGLIASLSTDADNLFLVLSAKGLNPNLIVSARVIDEESEQKLKKAGADLALSSYNITGSRLAQALLRPHVVRFLDFATMSIGADIGIEQVQVSDACGYADKSIGEARLRRDLSVIVLAVRKRNGTMLFNPDANTTISAGDHLIVMGESPDLRRLEHILSGAHHA